MIEFWRNTALLADAEMFRSLNQQFSGQNFRFGWSHVAVILLIVAAAASIIWLLNRLSRDDRQQIRNNPRGLFRELCRAHGLSLTHRRLLDQLASYQQLADPARLFLEPERFEPARLGPVLEPHQARFAALRDRLFAHGELPEWSMDDLG